MWVCRWPALLFFCLAACTGGDDPRQAVRAAQDAGRFQQAAFQLDMLAADQGWTAELYDLAGDLRVHIGDLAAAAGYWEAARQLDPAVNPVRLERLARAYVDLGWWPQAGDALTALVEAQPQAAWAQYQLGLMTAPRDPVAAARYLALPARTPQYTGIATELLRLVTDYRSDPGLSLRVGGFLADRGLWPYAEQAYRHAALVNSPSPEALAYVGLSRLRQGMDGAPWIQEAVRLDGENAVVRYVLALQLRAENDLVGSLNALIQAVMLEPDNPALYAELAGAYRLVGDLDGAEYWFRVAVEVSQDAPQFQELLALFYAETGFNLSEGGLPMLELAAAALPDSADARAAYGWGLYQTGDRVRGLAELDAALALDPRSPRALFFRALVALEEGDDATATGLLEGVASGRSGFAGDAARVLEEMRRAE